MTIDSLQNDTDTRRHLERQSRLESERSAMEASWRDVDERVDPQAENGFYRRGTVSGTRGTSNFDSTAMRGLGRYTAALTGLTIPRNQRWHGVATPDLDLNRSWRVQRWLEHAADRLFACRYVPFAGFAMNAAQDIRHGGKYGYSGLWVDEVVGKGLFYRAIPGPELYVDEDFRGRVDTTHRRFELSARQAAQKFGRDALSDKMLQCLTHDNPAKENERFEFVHVLCPNADYEQGHPGPEGKPIASVAIGVDEKVQIRRGAYATMPLVVSRTALGAKYGQAPALQVIGNIHTANEIAKTMLRATHKAVDPALAFFDDGNISKLSSKPGGYNPGLVDEYGRLLVHALPTATNLPWGVEAQERERADIKSAFLEELFQILTDPGDRMTATQVLEMIQKQGVLVGPFAEQHETEKLGPMIERELDILIRAGQIDPMPPEMVEARARPRAVYQNPLARMARAEEAAGFTRWVEIAVQIAAFDPSVFDHINTDRAMAGVADVLSVRPSWRNSPEEVEAKRQAREQREQIAQLAAAAPQAAGAALDLARANEIARAAA